MLREGRADWRTRSVTRSPLGQVPSVEGPSRVTELVVAEITRRT